jgi:alkylhydroperoxidase/carboxymuconolactone decarboxylase family protein YurZ
MDERERYRQGRELRTHVLGQEHVATAESGRNALNRALQELTTRWGWGESWSRTDLDLRTRSLVTVAMLIALGRPEELRIHMRGAVKNGASREEIDGVVLHAAVYCGLPAAHAAARVADEVFRV